jgi:succinate dehydrogenase / fumarate reductase cytochrome b subunit
MAVTGLVLILFLLVHAYGNLKIFLGQAVFNEYAHWLQQEILAPLIPHGWFIWMFRAVLLACAVIHVYCAVTLWLRAKKATPSSYEAKRKLKQSYSASLMRWGGLILAGGLVFHLLQFTVKATLTSGVSPAEEPATLLIHEFSQWWMVACYAVWMLAVCMHVRHGFASAFTTLGANTSARAEAVLEALTWVIAVLLYLGFIITPVAIFLGVEIPA